MVSSNVLWHICIHKSHSSFCRVHYWPLWWLLMKTETLQWCFQSVPLHLGLISCLGHCCFISIQTRTWTFSFSLWGCLASFPEIVAGGWQRTLVGPSATPKPSLDQCPKLHSLCLLMVKLELPRITPTSSNCAAVFTTICDWLWFYWPTDLIFGLPLLSLCLSLCFFFFPSNYSCYQWSHSF